MNRRGLLALLVVLALSIGLLSGCSQEEIGFINLLNQVNNLKVYETEQTLALSISDLPAGIAGDESNVAMIQNVLSQYSLKDTVRMNTNSGLWDGKVFLVNKTTGTEQELLSYLGSGETLYFKVDTLVSLAKTLGNPEINSKLALLGDARYVSISAKEFAELTGDPNAAAAFDFSNVHRQQNLYKEMMDGLSRKVFDKYSTGTIRKSNNQYILTMDKKAVLDNLVPMLTYSINNIEKIQSFSTDFLNNLDAQELALLSLTPEIRQAAVEGIDKAVPDIISNREQYLKEITAITPDVEQGLEFIGDDSKMTLAIEKTGDQEYTQATDLTFSFADPADSSETLGFRLEGVSIARAIAPFTVEVPTSGVVSLTELNDKLPRVVEIDTEYGEYHFAQGLKSDSGEVETKIIKGSTYLLLRDASTALTVNVGWDSKLKQAYVLKDGKTTNLTAVVVQGRAFVKIRDFEKLGYKVSWDPEAKIATISE